MKNTPILAFAGTVSTCLGAIGSPATAQQSQPTTPTQQVRASQPPATGTGHKQGLGDLCIASTALLGVGVAAVYGMKKENPRKTRGKLQQDDDAARRWVFYHPTDNGRKK